jgi:hypothetical protein
LDKIIENIRQERLTCYANNLTGNKKHPYPCWGASSLTSVIRKHENGQSVVNWINDSIIILDMYELSKIAVRPKLYTEHW